MTSYSAGIFYAKIVGSNAASLRLLTGIDGSTYLITNVKSLLNTCLDGSGKVFQEKVDLDISHHPHSFKAQPGVWAVPNCKHHNLTAYTMSTELNYLPTSMG